VSIVSTPLFYNDIPYFHDLSGLSTEGWIENRHISFCLKQRMTILAYDPYQYDKFSYKYGNN
jgi:hypothetical protein